MKKSLHILLTLVASSLAMATSYAAGDIESGKRLTFTCMGCHGQAGIRNTYPAYPVPKLGGQNAEYIVAALTAYRKGDRNHATVEGHANALSDQEIADIAVYFANIKDD